MYQSRRRILDCSKGFTLLDALFQLVIFSMFSQLLLLFILVIQQWNDSFLTNEHVNWEVFVQDFQQYLIQVNKITINNQSMTIQYTSGEQIKINQSSDVVWMQKNNEGYIPLLFGIRQVNFSLTDDSLTMKAEFLNGIVKERVLFVQYEQ